MDSTLRELSKKLGAIGAALINSDDSLAMAIYFPNTRIVEDEIIYITDLMTSLGNTMAERLKQGTMNRIAIDTQTSNIVMYAVDEKNVLLVITPKTVKLGLIFYEMQESANILRSILKRGRNPIVSAGNNPI
ncbi:MAG: hypothetical protein HUU50_02000 [Candidatus Brocadiae bacterium]|nr:hypothetical protein [Candidatus Brocadiia bacterium]